MIGPIILFGGYCLIYAAVAKGGAFATDPWNGIFADAYTDADNSSGTGVPAAPPAAGDIGAVTSGTPTISTPAASNTHPFSQPRPVNSAPVLPQKSLIPTPVQQGTANVALGGFTGVDALKTGLKGLFGG